MLQLKSDSYQTNILLALLVILMALVVILQYLTLTKAPGEIQPPSEKNLITPTLVTSPTPKISYKTYTGDKFAFDYPSAWTISSSNSGSVNFTTSANNQLQVVTVTDNSKTISDYLIKVDKLSQTGWEGQPSIQVQSSQKTVINNLNCIQRQEYLLAADLTRTSTYFKQGNLLLSISLIPTPGNNSSIDKTDYNQLLSTLNFLNTPDVSPTISVINKAKLLNTVAWIDHTCGLVSFKLPPGHSPRCTENTDGTFGVSISQEGSYSSYFINIGKYDGGSRRQHWINMMKASPAEVAKYVRFQETLFGKVSGLDVFASGGWWQGGYSSPILIANGKTLIYIYGGRNFDDQTGKISRWDITDTIASTITFK